MRIANKIVEEKKQYAREQIKLHPDWHTMLVNDKIEEKFGQKLNQAAISRIVQRMKSAKKWRKDMNDVKNPERAQTNAQMNAAFGPATPVELPAEVRAAAEALLDAQRKHRVEMISLHSNGVASVRVLKGVDGEVYLGGRRAADPKAT